MGNTTGVAAGREATTGMLSLWERREDEELEDTVEEFVVDREDLEDLDDEDWSITGTDPGGGALAVATSMSADSSTRSALRTRSSLARRSASTSSASTTAAKFDGRRALGAITYSNRLSTLYKSCARAPLGGEGGVALVCEVECAERARSSRLRRSESGEVGFGDGTCGMTCSRGRS